MQGPKWCLCQKLNERGKKMLNAKLERYLARPHAFPHEISSLYLYILMIVPL